MAPMPTLARRARRGPSCAAMPDPPHAPHCRLAPGSPCSHHRRMLISTQDVKILYVMLMQVLTLAKQIR